MKLQKRSTQESFFSGIYFINEEYSKSGFTQLLDKQLGTRCKQVGFSYSDIIQNLMNIFLCGGDCAEDIQTHLNKDLKSIPNNFDYDNQIIPAEKYNTKKRTKYSMDIIMELLQLEIK